MPKRKQRNTVAEQEGVFVEANHTKIVVNSPEASASGQGGERDMEKETTVFQCPKCGGNIGIDGGTVAEGRIWICAACGAIHVIHFETLGKEHLPDNVREEIERIEEAQEDDDGGPVSARGETKDTGTPVNIGDKTAKSCPECGPDVRLVVRANSRSGEMFLGCENYARCRYTEPVPEDLVMRAAGQQTLW